MGGVLAIDMTVEASPGNQHFPSRCMRALHLRYALNGTSTYIRIEGEGTVHVDDVIVHPNPRWTNQILYVKRTVLCIVIIGPDFVIFIYTQRIYINLGPSHHGKVGLTVALKH